MENTNPSLIEELSNRVCELKDIVEQLQAVQSSQQELITQLSNDLSLTKKIAREARQNASEAVWGEIFNNTISGSTWLKDKGFSPGRWAAGYPFLYALYRVLNEFHPRRILEMGLGQTTKMISQYAANDPGISHYVLENNAEWIQFYRNSYQAPDNTHITLLPLITDGVYKDDNAVYCYKNFAETFAGQQFDLITIDGPFGGAAQKYARTDVLALLPDCLSDQFVIFVDDSNRPGEQNTILEILSILDQHNIPYSKGEYKGIKNTYIITSEYIGFYCSM